MNDKNGQNKINVTFIFQKVHAINKNSTFFIAIQLIRCKRNVCYATARN